MFRFKNHLNDSFFDDINGKKLDKYQKKVITNNDRYLLVVAGAGSGKTLTIIGKVKYLIEKDGYHADEILCLSFTNETVNNLKSKLNYDVDVLTFHKLALKILKDNDFQYFIADDRLLEYIVNEFFYLDDYIIRSLLVEYFDNRMDYLNILKCKEFLILKNNIISFIKKIKCNNISLNKICMMKRRCVMSKDKILLYFSLKIFYLYENELISQRKIDFDDMIIEACNSLKINGIKKKYRYIIVDEYQDISLIRFNLIKRIIELNNCKLMCVGDDYQSIYGFSGSNISLFIDFFRYFPEATRIDIKNTYRNSYELIKTSLKFIQKNPYQLKKNIHAMFLFKNPIIIINYYNFIKSYNDLFNYLYLEDEKNVLVLSRYNNDLEDVKKMHHNGMNIRYLTVHMSKGLEEEIVVLIKFSNDYLGFPSKIMDARLLMMLNNNCEDISYAEERRLFYVALTRCRKKIYILVPRDNPSIFLREIKSSCVELLFK